MIVSASRRTDIPAFYSQWLINRIRLGYCHVPNPFNRDQVTRVDLTPEAVEAIVFWTRNPRPLFPYLAELDRGGYRYYFQYTLLNNPRLLEPNTPALTASLRTFHELAKLIGLERVIWRYDPIVLSNLSDVPFHTQNYERIANSLHGFTRRSVISLMDNYPKTDRRLKALVTKGLSITSEDDLPSAIQTLAPRLAEIAHTHGMEISSCAEKYDLQRFGVRPGKCVDDDYIQGVFGIEVTHAKDPNQRQLCGCVASKDIGRYNTCLSGCQYCYATNSFSRARKNYQAHNPQAEAL